MSRIGLCCDDMDRGAQIAEPIVWVEEFEGQLSTPLRAKRKYRSKRKEFVGWASKQLIEFLETIGKDTSKQLSQYDVTAIINEYANANRLHHPQKKKRIVCDDNLHFLFGRKTIGRNKIHDLLAVHFAENQEDSDDDFFYSSDEKEDIILTAGEQIKFSASERKPQRKKVNLGPPKSCFAAVVPENIKLVYLRKSVVSELLKDPETFEDKMIGSFIRIKCDPNDFLQKNSHQLLQVTGVKNISGTDDTNKEVLLEVSNSIKDVQIGMLSDDNFSEEECKDLHQRMKDGLLKKPTIGELEGKAQILHVDITKHWLARELALLQNRIDKANEKGWRKELYEYLERRKLLQTPSEQTRLFSEVPKVVAEEIEAVIVQDLPDNLEQEQNASPRSILNDSETPVCQAADNGNIPTWISSENQCAAFVPEEQKQPQIMLSFGNMPFQDLQYKGCNDVDKQIVTAEVSEYGGFPAMVDKQVLTTTVIEHNGSQSMVDKQVVTSQVIEHKGPQSMVDKKVVVTEVIDLSDDDEEETEKPSSKIQVPVNHLGSMIWHYADPQGDVQGPFSLLSLKKWNDANYFSPDFMVWRKGQSQDEAVLLRDVLGTVF